MCTSSTVKDGMAAEVGQPPSLGEEEQVTVVEVEPPPSGDEKQITAAAAGVEKKEQLISGSGGNKYNC